MVVGGNGLVRFLIESWGLAEESDERSVLKAVSAQMSCHSEKCEWNLRTGSPAKKPSGMKPAQSHAQMGPSLLPFPLETFSLLTLVGSDPTSRSFKMPFGVSLGALLNHIFTVLTVVILFVSLEKSARVHKF